MTFFSLSTMPTLYKIQVVWVVKVRKRVLWVVAMRVRLSVFGSSFMKMKAEYSFEISINT